MLLTQLEWTRKWKAVFAEDIAMDRLERYEDFYGFLDEKGAKEIPVFFVWDRTAALEEGDDKKDALLYPMLPEENDRDKEVVTRQLNLIAQVIGVMGKVEQIGRASCRERV